MMADLIVGGSIGLAVTFAAAWWWRPEWRTLIERPKLDFERALQGYDRARRPDSSREGRHPA